MVHLHNLLRLLESVFPRAGYSHSRGVSTAALQTLSTTDENTLVNLGAFANACVWETINHGSESTDFASIVKTSEGSAIPEPSPVISKSGGKLEDAASGKSESELLASKNLKLLRTVLKRAADTHRGFMMGEQFSILLRCPEIDVEVSQRLLLDRCLGEHRKLHSKTNL